MLSYLVIRGVKGGIPVCRLPGACMQSEAVNGLLWGKKWCEYFIIQKF